MLIPCFNEEKVIVSTVERILASDYRDLEVLVLDDGSKDHTAEWCAAFRASRASADLDSQRRQGQCAECRA